MTKTLFVAGIVFLLVSLWFFHIYDHTAGRTALSAAWLFIAASFIGAAFKAFWGSDDRRS